MTEPATEASPAQAGGRSLHVGMRWKLLIGFGGAFTLVFVVAAVSVLRFATNSANDRLMHNLREISVGGASTIDAEAFERLTQLDPTITVGATYPSDAGVLAGTTATADSEYPTDPLYWQHVNEMADIRRTNPEASTYSYFLAPDGQMRFAGSWGALGYPQMGTDPPDGGRFLQEVTAWVYGETVDYFRQGLDRTTFQPAYRDNLGSWVSVYTPITAADGRILGAIGVDYQMSYVDQVRSQVLRVLYPMFGIAYVVLLAMVFVLSSRLTRRLGRLSAATRRIAEGDYATDLESSTQARFPDEMADLARSFVVMADKVGQRERVLVEHVQVLKVEIDEQKRKQAVSEITDSDFFSDLTSKAGAMRAKMKGADIADLVSGHGPGETAGG